MFNIDSNPLSFEDATQYAIAQFNALPVAIQDEAKNPLYYQSAHGRAINGHFPYDKPYPNVTFDDIVRADREDPTTVRIYRQSLVDEYKPFFDRLLRGETPAMVNENGQPLYRVDFATEIDVTKPKMWLKGYVLAARMDNPYWRERAMEHPVYGRTLDGDLLEIGCGEEMLVDTDRLNRLGITLRDLQTDNHGPEDRKGLRDAGIMVDEVTGSNIVNQYVRFKKGQGVCDDAALLTIGKRHGSNAFFGASLGGDATDTWGKFIYAPVGGGADEKHADYIEAKWRELHGEELVTPDEIMEVIHLGAKNNRTDNDNNTRMHFSSSHRRFCQHELSLEDGSVSRYPTLIRHFLFLAGRRDEIWSEFGFDRYPSDKFYNNLDRRWDIYQKKTGNVFNPQQVNLNRSIYDQ